MSFMKKYLALIILLLSLPIVVGVSAQDVNDYFIYQEDREQKVPVYNGVIELLKEPFSIRLYNKKYDWDAKQPYTTKISVLKSKDVWKRVKTGGKAEKSLFFDGGSAFAITPKHRYSALFFSDVDASYIGGSHNIRYGNKDEDKTADLLNKVGDYFKLEFKVDNFFDKQNIKIEDSKISVLYFLIFSDKDLDGIIGEDELTKFKIKFKVP